MMYIHFKQWCTYIKWVKSDQIQSEKRQTSKCNQSISQSMCWCVTFAKPSTGADSCGRKPDCCTEPNVLACAANPINPLPITGGNKLFCIFGAAPNTGWSTAVAAPATTGVADDAAGDFLLGLPPAVLPAPSSSDSESLESELSEELSEDEKPPPVFLGDLTLEGDDFAAVESDLAGTGTGGAGVAMAGAAAATGAAIGATYRQKINQCIKQALNQENDQSISPSMKRSMNDTHQR